MLSGHHSRGHSAYSQFPPCQRTLYVTPLNHNRNLASARPTQRQNHLRNIQTSGCTYICLQLSLSHLHLPGLRCNQIAMKKRSRCKPQLNLTHRLKRAICVTRPAIWLSSVPRGGFGGTCRSHNMHGHMQFRPNQARSDANIRLDGHPPWQ